MTWPNAQAAMVFARVYLVVMVRVMKSRRASCAASILCTCQPVVQHRSPAWIWALGLQSVLRYGFNVSGWRSFRRCMTWVGSHAPCRRWSSRQGWLSSTSCSGLRFARSPGWMVASSFRSPSGVGDCWPCRRAGGPRVRMLLLLRVLVNRRGRVGQPWCRGSIGAVSGAGRVDRSRPGRGRVGLAV